jgi:nitroreductase
MRLAPSGGNRQPYKFIVIQNDETKKKIAAACRWYPSRPNGQGFIAEAPVVIVACGSDKEAVIRYYQDDKVFLAIGEAIADKLGASTLVYQSLMPLDLAIALDHLTLVATAEGLGTCWVSALDEREVKRVLSVPEDSKVLAVMPVGYPVSWPQPRPRKPLDQIVCYEKYG